MAIVDTNPRCPSSQKSTFFILQNYLSSHFNTQISHLNFAKRKSVNKSEIIKTHTHSLFHQRGLKWKHEETLEISILSQFYKTNKHSLAQFYSAVNIKSQEYIQDTSKV